MLVFQGPLSSVLNVNRGLFYVIYRGLVILLSTEVKLLRVKAHYFIGIHN